MAKAEIVLGELSGGGVKSVEATNVASWAVNTPLSIPTTKKAKGICVALKVGSNFYNEVLCAFDGVDGNVIHSNSATYAATATFNSNSIEFDALATTSTNASLYGYIFY